MFQFLVCFVFLASLQSSDEIGAVEPPPYREDSGAMVLTLTQLVMEMRWVREMLQDMAGLMEEIQEIRHRMEGQEEKLGDLGNGIEQSNVKIGHVNKMLDLMRSDVRLISQHKLTWMNSSYDGKYLPDFVVDGVYLNSEDYHGSNPTAHVAAADQTKRNNMLILDLGSIYKIHTIKVWNRMDGLGYNQGIMVYVDKNVVGSLVEPKRLNNIYVSPQMHVYGQKVILKQPRASRIMFLEIQVYGTGPYAEDEI